jgi:hypothetical protein
MSDKYIKPATRLAARMLADEMIVMSLDDARVFSLNPTASALWSAADGSTPLREIVSRTVVSQFEVDPEVAYQDAIEVVTKLAEAGILLVSDNPIPQETSSSV